MYMYIQIGTAFMPDTHIVVRLFMMKAKVRPIRQVRLSVSRLLQNYITLCRISVLSSVLQVHNFDLLYYRTAYVKQ